MGTQEHWLKEEGTSATKGERRRFKGLQSQTWLTAQFYLGLTSVLPGIYFFSKGLRDRGATAPIAWLVFLMTPCELVEFTPPLPQFKPIEFPQLVSPLFSAFLVWPQKVFLVSFVYHNRAASPGCCEIKWNEACEPLSISQEAGKSAISRSHYNYVIIT